MGGSRPVKDHDGAEVLNPITLRTLLGRLVFRTRADGEEETLWESDGTQAGTVPLLPLASSPEALPNSLGTNLAVAGNRLFFANFNEETGTELWALAP